MSTEPASQVEGIDHDAGASFLGATDAGVAHHVALQAYDPDRLPDFDVFRGVVECSARSVEAAIGEVA